MLTRRDHARLLPKLYHLAEVKRMRYLVYQSLEQCTSFRRSSQLFQRDNTG